jgi:hypothetical protein
VSCVWVRLFFYSMYLKVKCRGVQDCRLMVLDLSDNPLPLILPKPLHPDLNDLLH